MSEILHALEAWAGALLAKLQPAQRRAINHKVAIDLRRSQAQRIKAQQGPDGAAYPARKKRKELKQKKGRIKRQRVSMFAKIRTAKYLKVDADPGQLTVGFLDKVMHIARVHHDGLADKVSKKGPKYTYPARPLLGIGEADRTLICESLLHHFGKF
ncbi:phage virion morphogenesis protein [Janthinobacterium lividum]|nr:phage virion morphogenesis protein [Janthinobacterium lividum]